MAEKASTDVTAEPEISNTTLDLKGTNTAAEIADVIKEKTCKK